MTTEQIHIDRGAAGPPTPPPGGNPPQPLWANDLRLLTLGTLIDAKIISLPKEELERAAQGQTREERRIPGGQYILPPWCVWPLPTSHGAQKVGRAAVPIMAPPARFLGVSPKALAAAGISRDQHEVEAHANDPEWAYEAMRAVRGAGGFVYGGMWALCKFPFNSGVDTSDIQRLLEWAMDQLAMRPTTELRGYLLGHATARLEITSKRRARGLVTGWDSDPNSTRSAWNHLAHPTFHAFTRQHQGPVTSESLGEIRVFRSITQHFQAHEVGKGLAQGCTLEVSTLGVALAVGQAARMSHLIADPMEPGFNPRGVQRLVTWLWSLGERERRLARHLVLSPGDDGSYQYLLEQVYGAAVLGRKAVQDRRYDHRTREDLLRAGRGILSHLPSLQLPSVESHLEKALTAIGVTLSAPEPPQDCDTGTSEDNLPRIVTPPQDCDTSPGLRQEPPQDCDKDLPRIVTPPQDCDGPPQDCDATLPRIVTENEESLCEIKELEAPISSFSLDDSLGINLSVCQSSAHVGAVEEPDRQTDSNTADFTHAVTLPVELQDLLPWVRTLGEEWPQQVRQPLGEFLGRSPQDLERTSWLSGEGAWIVYQWILSQPKLESQEGSLTNALRSPERAARWLRVAGPIFQACGWREEVTDGTERESRERRQASEALAKKRLARLPLSPQEEEERKAILREDQARAEAVTVRLTDLLLNAEDEEEETLPPKPAPQQVFEPAELPEQLIRPLRSIARTWKDQSDQVASIQREAVKTSHSFKYMQDHGAQDLWDQMGDVAAQGLGLLRSWGHRVRLNGEVLNTSALTDADKGRVMPAFFKAIL